MEAKKREEKRNRNLEKKRDWNSNLTEEKMDATNAVGWWIRRSLLLLLLPLVSTQAVLARHSQDMSVSLS